MLWTSRMVADCTATWCQDHALQRIDEHLRVLLTFLEARLPYLCGRAARVVTACKLIGLHLKLAPDKLRDWEFAAHFHDIGLLAVPDRLLMSERELTAEERTLVSRHTDQGGRLVAKLLPCFPDVIEAIWWHHERPDGKGPHGLAGDEIPALASVIALVEAVDAMANGRPHRPALPFERIRLEIDGKSGTQFAPAVVTAFRRLAPRIHQVMLADPAGAAQAEDGAKNKPAADVAPSRPDAPQPAAGATQAPAGQPDAARGAGRQVRQPADALRALRELAPLMKKNELTELVATTLELKPLAPSVQEVMSVTANPYCDAEDLAKAVASDPVLSMRVLRLANSSAYARGRPIDSIRSAVQRVGTAEIRSMVVSLGVLQQYEGLTSEHVDLQSFWEHSFATGLIARAVAVECRAANAEDYFLWGVLHDVGRLVLLEQAAAPYAQVLQAAARLNLPVEVVERKLLLSDHCAAAAQVFERWGFGQPLVAAVGSHHLRASVLQTRAGSKPVGVAAVALADRLAHALLLGRSGNDVLYRVNDLVALLELRPDAIDRLAESALKDVQSLRIAVMARDHGGRAALADTLRESLKAPVRPVCAHRDGSVSLGALLLGRIASADGAELPNVGLLWLRSADEQDNVFARYEVAEREARASGLPLLVICEQGEINQQSGWLKGRRSVVLSTPVRVALVGEALNELLQ